MRLLTGYQREIVPDLTLSGQYSVQVMEDHGEYVGSRGPSMPRRDPARHVLTARLTQLLRHQTLRLGLFALASPSDGDWYLGPEARYQITDALSATVGLNAFGGPRRCLACCIRSPVHGLPQREGEQPRVLAGIFVQVGLGAWRKRRLGLHQTVDNGPRPALTLRSEDLTRRVVTCGVLPSKMSDTSTGQGWSCSQNGHCHGSSISPPAPLIGATHNTHAHSAEADALKASRKQSRATRMHSQRFIIDATSVVVTQARISVGFTGRSGWSRGLPDEHLRCEMPRFIRAVPRAAVSENRLRVTYAPTRPPRVSPAPGGGGKPRRTRWRRARPAAPRS